jgi:hypothetical protein
MSAAMNLVLGIDAFVALSDITGLDRAEALDILERAAATLLRSPGGRRRPRRCQPGAGWGGEWWAPHRSWSGRPCLAWRVPSVRGGWVPGRPRASMAS